MSSCVETIHKPDKLVLLFSVIGKHINWLLRAYTAYNR